ncbi:MAG: DUF420 domain-containing protein [Verrucomicrobia bacterium]|nr:DUF420 domain-containing protein [Verrucomicrobiota bacterium]
MIQGSDLPALNAALNTASVVLLVGAYIAVKAGRLILHRDLMIAAIMTSAMFLASYLTYHFGFQLTKRYEGAFRPVYLAILFSHTVLAVPVLPLVLITAARALRAQKAGAVLGGTDVRARFARHRAIARWTLPIWLYVSLTGVAVYWMLYHHR